MATTSDWWSRRLGSQPPAAPPAAPSVYQPVLPGSQPPPQPLASDQIQTGDAYMDQVGRAAIATGGSKQVQEDSGRCPECGSGNYFSRNYTEQGMRMRNPAAARCYDCGFPLIQAGSSHGGATTARTDGTATRARQLPKDHAVTVVDGGRSVTYQPR